MKKLGVILLTLVLAMPLLLFGGCLRETDVTTKNVFLKNIETTSSIEYDGSFTEFIANEKACAVVSICSYFQYRNNKGNFSKTYKYFSGLVLNDGGYILTTSQAVSSYAADQSTSLESITASNFWISFNPLFEHTDDDYYNAQVIDCDTNIGLAILKFTDTFYYYTDSANTQSKQGFQFKAEFFDSRNTTKTGDVCAFVGDMLDEGVSITTGVIADNEMTVLDGVSIGEVTYNYIQASAALNEEMYGGALYDENGYVIGISQTKIVSDTDYTVFNKIGLALPSAAVMNYIDAVSEKLQTVIEYTVVAMEV